MNININNKMDNDIDSKTSRIGISLPSSLLLKIDKERGDISRSKFLFRILEKRYKEVLKSPILQTEV
jgi:hypothetical protein